MHCSFQWPDLANQGYLCRLALNVAGPLRLLVRAAYLAAIKLIGLINGLPPVC